MKEIFDRRYPVTSFFLLVTALVFILMLVTTGGNFTGQIPYFDLEPCMGLSFVSFLSRFGVSSLLFLFILGGSISLLICFRFITLVGK